MVFAIDNSSRPKFYVTLQGRSGSPGEGKEEGGVHLGQQIPWSLNLDNQDTEIKVMQDCTKGRGDNIKDTMILKHLLEVQLLCPTLLKPKTMTIASG